MDCSSGLRSRAGPTETEPAVSGFESPLMRPGMTVLIDLLGDRRLAYIDAAPTRCGQVSNPKQGSSP
jgi:hypothetical protein